MQAATAVGPARSNSGRRAAMRPRLPEVTRAADVATRCYRAPNSELVGSTPRHALRLRARVNYRDAYGLATTKGILFNHDSPRRGETFVTGTITRAVARIAAGWQEKVYLGNLDGVHDRGFAPEYVEGVTDAPGDERQGTLAGSVRPGRAGLAEPRRLRRPATSARPRATYRSGTRRKLRASSGGRRRPSARRWCT